MAGLPSYFVIGPPLGHSMSPVLHSRLFALSGRPAAYEARDIPPEQLSAALREMLPQVQGLNVTIPHKQAVIPLLDRLEGRAKLYRSVNTIAVTESGAVGYNTDADGFLCALKAGGVSLAGRVALLGCGGVGRTFACEAALAGCRLINAVRPEDFEASRALKDYVLSLVPGAAFETVELSRLSGDFDLLINATPVGMYPRCDASPVDPGVLARCAAVFDAVYNPEETRLLSAARAAGARTVGGMPMLVWQAAVAHTCWYGADFQAEAVASIIADANVYMNQHFRQ